MRDDERDAVARLIHESTNHWYRQAGKSTIFAGDPLDCRVFTDVYEDLDPGCCVVAFDESSNRLMGSCFYHPRPTHVSLGIMNVHPGYFRKGVASALLKHITDFADARMQPMRLVSSAMNLDSFSLYSRAGFVPKQLFIDMILPNPPAPQPSSGLEVRAATLDDVAAMESLEWRVVGIRRADDYRYFITNRRGIWHVSVAVDASGILQGFLCSVKHPASRMLGPGAMTTDAVAAQLILAELSQSVGGPSVFLVPADRPGLVKQLYAWGARNLELHVSQCRGEAPPVNGIVMPTFMPETG
jgi:GNAT superfamily N-acetyltransferase